MTGSDAVAGVVTLIVLATIIVCWGGVFQPKNQNWTTILTVALAIPFFILLMAGVVGIFLG